MPATIALRVSAVLHDPARRRQIGAAVDGAAENNKSSTIHPQRHHDAPLRPAAVRRRELLATGNPAPAAASIVRGEPVAFDHGDEQFEYPYNAQSTLHLPTATYTHATCKHHALIAAQEDARIAQRELTE